MTPRAVSSLIGNEKEGATLSKPRACRSPRENALVTAYRYALALAMIARLLISDPTCPNLAMLRRDEYRRRDKE